MFNFVEMSRIFISYKRKDFGLVQNYIREIEAATGVKCWFDLENISTSEQFASVICQAIDECEIFLFMHSSSHLGIDFQTDWTIRELNYAIAKKKRVVLVKMDDSHLDNIFLMLFGATSNIQITDPLQKQKLFRDISSWTGVPAVVPTGVSSGHPKTLLLRKYVFAAAVSLVLILSLLLFVNRPWSASSPEFIKDLPEVNVSTGVGKVNGFDYVDLGLPSGTKWARCNVGASQPWEYGEFFAWGEIIAKEAYYQYNLRFNEGGDETFALSKYDGAVTVLLPEDDAASVNMGASWRMPTKEETEELARHCVWERAMLNGVPGEKIIGMNGNSIFLPYTGFRYKNEYREEGWSASFWTSSLDPAHPEKAYYLYSGISDGVDVHKQIMEIERYPGTAIRAVTK